MVCAADVSVELAAPIYRIDMLVNLTGPKIASAAEIAECRLHIFTGNHCLTEHRPVWIRLVPKTGLVKLRLDGNLFFLFAGIEEFEVSNREVKLPSRPQGGKQVTHPLKKRLSIKVCKNRECVYKIVFSLRNAAKTKYFRNKPSLILQAVAGDMFKASRPGVSEIKLIRCAFRQQIGCDPSPAGAEVQATPVRS